MVIILLQHIAKCRLLRNYYHHYFNFCCFDVLCAITPSIGVINYILKIYAFKFAVLLPISAVGQG